MPQTEPEPVMPTERPLWVVETILYSVVVVIAVVIESPCESIRVQQPPAVSAAPLLSPEAPMIKSFALLVETLTAAFPDVPVALAGMTALASNGEPVLAPEMPKTAI